MPTMLFTSHLPLLRIGVEDCPFGFGRLWRLPFEAYNQMTLGAFSDHQKAYEATAPVFFYLEIEHDWPFLRAGREGVEGVQQMKFPSHKWSLLPGFGLDFLPIVMENFIEPAWAALSLAAPAAVLPSPRLSTLFAVPDGDFSVDLPGMHTLGIQIQGDADQEFLFMPEAAAAVLADSDLASAEAILRLTNGIVSGQNPVPNPRALPPEVRAALDALLASAAPSLTPPERLTLCVTALESLLLPEVMTGLGSTFARRLSVLCGADPGHRAAMKKTGQKLYSYRSKNVHGGSGGHNSETLQQAEPQQILAASILAAAVKVQAGLEPENLPPSLDDEAQPFNPAAAGLPLDSPPGLRRGETMLMRRSPVVIGFSPTVDMSIQEGFMISWSPLIGLGVDLGESSVIGQPPLANLATLDAQELLVMEDRDTRRDFSAELHLIQHRHAVLGVVARQEGDPYTLPDDSFQSSLRTRDLVVLALRMAGFKEFYDPELLGWFIYVGKGRLRRPTIYRQSILIDFRLEPEQILAAADLPRVNEHADRLAAYSAEAQHPAVNHVLRLFRRSFDNRFLPFAGRAGLMLSCLEAMLGRFRKREDPIQLEDMAAVFTAKQAPAATEWFRAEGRKFRNAVAHGYWEPQAGAEQPPLEHLLNLLTALVPAFVQIWLDAPDRAGSEPESVFSAAARSALDSRKRG